MNIKSVGILLGGGALVLVAYALVQRPVPKASPQKVGVVTSFYPLYFFAQQVGGDKAQVVNITPAGGEPHEYEPTARDIAQMESSKLLVLNGGNLEAWGDHIKQNLDPKRTLIVNAGEGLFTQQVAEDAQNMTDPHVWLSPPLAKQMVEKIEAGFVQVDPSNAPTYAANAAELTSKLTSLDTAYQQGLAHCETRDIVTAHAAFGYLASAYHLHQVSIAGLSPDAEPSPQQLADITNFAKKNHVKSIFFESLVSPKFAETIAQEIGVKTMVLNPLEGLTNEEIAQSKNYLTEMQQNLTNLQTALLCTP